MQNFRILPLAVAALVFFLGLRLMRSRFQSNPIAAVRGPPSPSWLYGNMVQLSLAENYGDHEFQWQKQYGPLYRIKGCLGQDRLVVSDPQALKYILNNPTLIRSPGNSKTFHLLFGKQSVFVIEGDEHRRLRAAMSTGFSGSSVRTFLPIFVDVAKKMTHEWGNMCSPGSSTRLNVGKMFSHATLDIICDGIHSPSSNSFCICVRSIQVQAHSPHSHGLHAVLGVTHGLRLPFGPLSPIVSFRRVTQQLMDEKGRAFMRFPDEKRDLLSIILSGRAASKTAVTHSQLLKQLPLILVAGQDTSAAALSWAFYWLAQNPEFQQNLRQEILSANLNSEDSTGEFEYDNMNLLNALLKETLRMFPPGPLFERCASEDLVLPLSTEIVTSTGKHIRELPIQKGQVISLALGAYQRMESLWGSDAHEFKPSRWLDGDPYKGQIGAGGPYANLLAFMGGHRVCAGWRFALLEMQVILTELVRKFSFALPKDSVVRVHFSATQFPVDGEGAKGLWLSVERIVD
ncbi:cytochrome P450 [Mycena latifolia]|nr:cytochrome P450 [Mycena latifolia]